MLQGTIFAIPNCLKGFLVISAIVTIWGTYTFYLALIQAKHCSTKYNTAGIYAFAFCEGFWNISLFFVFIFKLCQMLKVKQLENDLNKDLKNYLKKLFRLFLVTEITNFLVYVILLISRTNQFGRIALGIDLCFTGTAMLLSLKFTQPCYDVLCLCKF